MRTVMEYVSQFDRVAAHCEIESISAGGVNGGSRKYAPWYVWLAKHFWRGAEISETLICRLTGCPLHICHISTGRSRAGNVQLRRILVIKEVSTTILLLSEDDITDTYTNLKMNPPPELLRMRLLFRLQSQTVQLDCIVTDHALCHEKDCEWKSFSWAALALTCCL